MTCTTHRYVFAALLALGLTLAPVMKNAAGAADADWGCQVLLCAASQNPGWQGVPYCLAPMRKLITSMAMPLFSWPLCAAAGTGAPGHEPYDDCATSYTPTRSSDGSDGRQPSDYDRCFRRIDNGLNCHSPRGDTVDCSQVEIMDRPVRAKPYYFDISQPSGQKQRVWFSLDE